MTITGVLTENLITLINGKNVGLLMSKEGLEKAKEIAKLIRCRKYEYYTPSSPMQKMMKEERLRLNCYDNQRIKNKK